MQLCTVNGYFLTVFPRVNLKVNLLQRLHALVEIWILLVCTSRLLSAIAQHQNLAADTKAI